jgi:DNA-binding MltR family transcriptional regulator
MSSEPLSKIPSAASKKLLKELPSPDEMSELIGNLKQAGHRATAILGAAYLEHALESLLRAYMTEELSKEEVVRLFDGAQGGILGSFSAKIRVAYAIRLLHRNPYRALLLMNDIRNVFAHSLYSVDFCTDLIVQDCKQLTTISEELADAARITADDPAIDIYASMARTLYLSLHMAMEKLAEGRSPIG